jgi:hypothetical protein
MARTIIICDPAVVGVRTGDIYRRIAIHCRDNCMGQGLKYGNVGDGALSDRAIDCNMSGLLSF